MKLKCNRPAYFNYVFPTQQHLFKTQRNTFNNGFFLHFIQKQELILHLSGFFNNNKILQFHLADAKGVEGAEENEGLIKMMRKRGMRLV